MPVQTYREAIQTAKEMGLGLIPYENARGIQATKEVMKGLGQFETIGVLIGPEGGFEESEIEFAKANEIKPISLGRRILRTETAGLATLSMMMLELEE